jgi:methylmalonyl-CoA/ethylmalonyl-CoA epimerase
MSGVAGLSRIGQITMRAKDTDRAVRFYRDTLGLPLLFTAPPGLAFFECGGVRLMLGPGEGEFDRPGSVIYFTVDDIQSTHRVLAERGVVFRQKPHMVARLPDREVWVGIFDDTEGNTLAILSEPALA